MITELLIATDRQAIVSPEQHHNLTSPLGAKRNLFEDLPWMDLFGSLKPRAHAVCLDIWKQATSRLRELTVWSGIILGPLETGHTRITWKSVSAAP
jgi:hypothetical protein